MTDASQDPPSPPGRDSGPGSAAPPGPPPGSAAPPGVPPGSAAPPGVPPGSAAPGSAGPGEPSSGTPWAGPEAWEVPWPAAPPQPRRPARAAAVAAAIVAAVAALGAPLGLLWAALAPTVPVRMTGDGALLVESQPEEFVAADGWFSLLGLGFGALAAIAVWLVVRRRGPLALLAVTVGALAAGLLAWWLGRQVGASEYQRLLADAPEGTVFGKPADLRAADADLLFGFLPVVRGDALVPALGAAVVYTLLAGWSRFPSLRAAEETPDAPLSWDSTVTPAHPAAPAPPVPGAAAPPPD